MPCLGRVWIVFVLLLACTCQRPAPAEPPAKPTDEATVERRANRLATETSPYLLLHAHNPVDWHPWGPEALAKAKADGKMIFLSIGYSACHWCHVMERESFMDDEIADYLNEHFVCIKVDREERPDIDEIYMTALNIYYQAIGSARGGGWPLSMFLTPEARPLAGGTYFPPRDRPETRQDGFLTVLGRVQSAWADDPDVLRQRADILTEYVQASLRRRPALDDKLPGREVNDDAQSAFADEYDPEHGGFGYSEVNPREPKFPRASVLMFLADRALPPQANDQARDLLLGTLDHIIAGGIYDHLGGGFHRYSVDRYWLVPHFEKMLYDNGQLLSVLAAAWQLRPRDEYRIAAAETADFLLRELRSPQGAFYAALDADSGAGEGDFYAWDRDEIQMLLGAERFAVFAARYLADDPSFEDRWVLALQSPPRDWSALDEKDRHLLDESRALLFAARAPRERPATDTKVLTDWNGLAIRGLADAGRVFQVPEYTQAAATAADFLLANVRGADGRLLHSHAGGQARLNAYVDDYAHLVDGLIALHRATADPRWLTAADELTTLQIDLFWDDEEGGFFFTSDDHEDLLARSKDPVDSATPAGNAVTAGNLVYLGRELGKPEYLDRAERTIRVFAPLWQQAPTAMPRLNVSFAALLDARTETPSP
jgi:uncharacterized protein YyaL (SSP411 family)